MFVFNNWGKFDPNTMEGQTLRDISISFKAAGVADVLAKTGAKSIKAFIGVNSSDWSVNTLGNTVPSAGVVEIEKDGTYTVSYTAAGEITLGNQLGVMFADIDSALEKDDDKNVTAGLTISDVTMKTTELKFADDTEGTEVTKTPEPTDAPKTYDEALLFTKVIYAFINPMLRLFGLQRVSMLTSHIRWIHGIIVMVTSQMLLENRILTITSRQAVTLQNSRLLMYYLQEMVSIQ